eukprot:5328031-Pyramimonas_sp.AAC.3
MKLWVLLCTALYAALLDTAHSQTFACYNDWPRFVKPLPDGPRPTIHESRGAQTPLPIIIVNV